MLIKKEESYRIIGAAMQVHQRLGCGFLEEVYQEAFERELIAQRISYEREKMLQIFYRDLPLEKYYKVEFRIINKFW